jgi:hypothetical protein
VLQNAQQPLPPQAKDYVFQMTKDKELNIWPIHQSQEASTTPDLRELFSVHSF